jgi:hypothetical protein
MKKIVFLSIAFSLLAGMSMAQWSSNGTHIYNTNTGNVGIGITTPATLLDVAKNMTEPAVAVRNLGGASGAAFRLYDQVSSADWKLKTLSNGGFRIRDNAYGMDVVQIEPNSEANALYINASGLVGIGNAAPAALLDAARNMAEPTIAVRNLGGTGGASFRMYDQTSTADWKFKVFSGGGFKIRDNANGLDVIQIEANSAANVIYINAAGNLGIGTTNPTEKLSINGNVKCKQVEVSLTGWSDFVFEKNYALMPLSEVEKYINKHGHLPGVPSEEEVVSNGNNLGEMDAILLQKIEELTLYVIELKKENERLRRK